MTRNDTTSYREQGRAMFLAALMILSVVAVPAAFAGGAAATADEPGTYDQLLGGNQVYQGQTFQVTNLNDTTEGSSVSFNGKDDDVDDSTTQINLVEITERSGAQIDNARQVRPISYTNTTNDGQVTLDTSDLEPGEYAFSNETGVSGKILTPFTVTAQDFSVDIDDDSVTDADNTTVAIESTNRPAIKNQNVTISVSGPEDLDAITIKQMFNASDSNGNAIAGRVVTEAPNLPLDHLDYDRSGGDGQTELEDDGYVTLNLSNYTAVSPGLNSDDELELDLRNVAPNNFPDAGEYEFEFIITDTGETATDSVQISDANQDASFAEGATQTPAGDIAQFEITFEDTSDGYVQIGGPEADFVDVLYIEADDSSEPVTVQINTRLLGTEAGLDAVYDRDNAASFESEMHGGGVSTHPDSISLYEDDGAPVNNDFDTYLDNLGIIDTGTAGEDRNDQLVRPLQATDYEIVAAGTDDGTAVFDADSNGEPNDQLDSKVMELTQPEISDITTHTAPEASANDETDLEDLLAAATQREEVAVGDRLIVQVEATGIYGAMVGGAGGNMDPAETSNFDVLDDGVNTQALQNLVDSNESVNFEITAESSTGNQDPLQVDLTASAGDSYVVLDEDNGQFFVIVDTSSDSAFANGDAPDEDVTFTAELEYDADNNDNRFQFENANTASTNSEPFSVRSGGYVNYPYLLQGETLSSSTELDLAPRSIDFENVNVDDVLEAENIAASEISGTTNVAPGSDAEIRVSSSDASTSFRNGQSVNISEDGTVSGEFDFDGQEVGDEFETAFSIAGSSVDSTDSVLVEEGSLGTGAPEDGSAEDETEDETDDSTDESSGDSTDDSTDESSGDSTDDSTDESTDDNTPGFGALVALVALIGAALLATRRQN